MTASEFSRPAALPQGRETPVQQATRTVAGALMAGCFLLVLNGPARSLTGAEDVGPDDIGAKASVAIYTNGKAFCGGTVIEDRYILASAHCFTDGKGNVDIRPREIKIFYWGSGKSPRESRTVTDFAIHESYPQQQRIEARGNLWNWDDFPVNHDDIAVLKIDGTHPATAVSAFMPGIDNDYTGEGEFPSGKSTWIYLYGASSRNAPFTKLQRAITGISGPMQRVVPGKKQSLMSYQTRTLLIIADGFDKKVWSCGGDSGSGVFLIDSDGLDYESEPEKLPAGGIKRNEGHPTVVAVMKGVSVSDKTRAVGRCGRDPKQEGIAATRVDHYHDWIYSKIKAMQ